MYQNYPLITHCDKEIGATQVTVLAVGGHDDVIGVAQVKIESRNQQMLSTGTLFSWKASYYMNHITL